MKEATYYAHVAERNARNNDKDVHNWAGARERKWGIEKLRWENHKKRKETTFRKIFDMRRVDPFCNYMDWRLIIALEDQNGHGFIGDVCFVVENFSDGIRWDFIS